MYISEVSKQSGLSIHTLRYYEKEGLLTEVSRDVSGRRVYSNNDLIWLSWIQRLKTTGMKLDDIKQFSALRKIGDSSISDRKDMLIHHAQKLKADIQRLEDELEVVEYKVSAYAEKEHSLLT
ncbi:MerR family transcriptional regulator [Agaribacterium haliotis]|uniref:MerR family transcriptional regulator n=1 Tax=Agaribacterium haliotis TaxID=2013869 RepID=UPI000BB5490C|nr:MerR family transcriptional regulator [Agaribacterium haliotis]